MPPETSEHEPLLGDTGDVRHFAAHDGEQGIVELVRRNITSGFTAFMAQLGLLMLIIPVWVFVLQHPAGLFTPHPLLQTAGVFFLFQGILLLQPTKTASAKRQGLAAHQVAQVIGLLALAAGTSVIIYNKVSHSSPHFTSWHGRFGIVTASLVVLQALVGALVVYDAPQKAIFGGEARAKALWKWHRLSGYLFVVLLSVTVGLAIDEPNFVQMISTYRERVTVNVGLILAFVGVVGRLTPSKLPAAVRV